MKKWIIAALLSVSSMAQAATVEEVLLQKFAQCDGSMFEFIKEKQDVLKAYAPIENRNDVASFKLLGSPTHASVIFNKPLEIKGVHFTGYSSRYFELPLDSTTRTPLQSYFWGFTLNETDLAAVAKALPELQLTPNGEHMIANPQINRNVALGNQWVYESNPKGGTIPAFNTAEKLLLLAKEDGKVTLNCTVQGYLTPTIIQAVRPDLNR